MAPVLRTLGISVSVIEPGPVRTAFLRNACGRTAQVTADDPYADLLNGYNRTMAGLLATGESPDDVAAVIASIARDPQPAFRYQSSANGTAIASRKVVDPTSNSIVAATTAFLIEGPPAPTG